MSIKVEVTNAVQVVDDSRNRSRVVVIGLGTALEFFVRASSDPTVAGLFCVVCEDEQIVFQFGNQHWLPSDSPFYTREFVPGGLRYTMTPIDSEIWSLFRRFVLPAIAARPGSHSTNVGEYLDANRSARC